MLPFSVRDKQQTTEMTTTIYIVLVMMLLLSSHHICQAFVTPTSTTNKPAAFTSKHAYQIENLSHQDLVASKSLFFETTDVLTSPLLLSSNEVSLKTIATGLGYLIGAASVLLYTPIAIRVLRTKSADGLTLSTWWLKLTHYTCTVVYNIKNGFPISAFSESLVISVEAVVILGLVTYYQKRLDVQTFLLAVTYFAVTSWALFSPALFGPSDETIAFAQKFSIVLNVIALIPQLYQNYERKSAGDYSPTTASLASIGCTVRLFTTIELTSGDPLLLINYAVAMALNLSLLLQIIYYGTQKEGKTLSQLYLADVQSE